MASGRHPSFCLLASPEPLPSATPVLPHQSFKAALARCARGRFLPGLGWEEPHHPTGPRPGHVSSPSGEKVLALLLP